MIRIAWVQIQLFIVVFTVKFSYMCYLTDNTNEIICHMTRLKLHVHDIKALGKIYNHRQHT